MTILEGINQNWGIILFLAGLIFHALWTYFTVGNHTVKIKSLESKNMKTDIDVASINTKISSIDAKLDILLTGYHRDK